jgi:hypothetical protein
LTSFLSIGRKYATIRNSSGKMATTKRGRPRKPAIPGQRSALGLRVTPQIKELLDSKTKQSGRTQSQEAELRIELTFRAEQQLAQGLELVFGRQLSGLLMLLGRAMRDAGHLAGYQSARTFEGAENWMCNSYAYDQAAEAANVILEAFRPQSEPLLDELDRRNARVRLLLSEVLGRALPHRVGKRRAEAAELLRRRRDALAAAESAHNDAVDRWLRDREAGDATDVAAIERLVLGLGVADNYLAAVLDPESGIGPDLKYIGADVAAKVGETVTNQIRRNIHCPRSEMQPLCTEAEEGDAGTRHQAAIIVPDIA